MVRKRANGYDTLNAMPNMLPSFTDSDPSLADVLTSSLHAVLGQANPLGLQPTVRMAVLLVDGLGYRALRERSAYARFLNARMTPSSFARSRFPSTTVAGIGSLTTGLTSGEHGMLGYSLLDRPRSRIVNLISGWDRHVVPEVWQPQTTVFEQSAQRDVPSFAVGPAKYKNSGLSRALLRGAEYRSADGISEALETMLQLFAQHPKALVYLYHPKLDMVGHATGWQSEKWTAELEELDAALRKVEPRLGTNGLIVTADHGMVDVTAANHVYVDHLVKASNTAFIGGEPRCLQLYLADRTRAGHAQQIWSSALEDAAWVLTTAEAIELGLFGRMRPEYVDRVGDLIVLAKRDDAVFYNKQTTSQSALAMVGQHGGLTDYEQLVPMIRLGAASS